MLNVANLRAVANIVATDDVRQAIIAAADEIEQLRAALTECSDLLILGDERGNPNERELKAHKLARSLLEI